MSESALNSDVLHVMKSSCVPTPGLTRAQVAQNARPIEASYDRTTTLLQHTRRAHVNYITGKGTFRAESH